MLRMSAFRWLRYEDTKKRRPHFAKAAADACKPRPTYSRPFPGGQLAHTCLLVFSKLAHTGEQDVFLMPYEEELLELQPPSYAAADAFYVKVCLSYLRSLQSISAAAQQQCFYSERTLSTSSFEHGEAGGIEYRPPCSQAVARSTTCLDFCKIWFKPFHSCNTAACE